MKLPDAWRKGVVAVVGLGKSGVAATRLLVREGVRVYASDSTDHPYAGAAAESLRALPGVDVDLGRHDLAKIRAAAGVVVSPGVPPDAPPLAAARDAGIEIVSELDLGFRAIAAAGETHCIAITGTNGKTTTTPETSAVPSPTSRSRSPPIGIAGSVSRCRHFSCTTARTSRLKSAF